MRAALQAANLGLRPTVDSVYDWFSRRGFERIVAGRSYEGRDLIVFRLVVRSVAAPSAGGAHKRTVLFQSLLHGNEPLGLTALLHTAEALLHPRAVNRQLLGLRRLDRDGNGDGVGVSELELLFFPIVNVDAYALNLLMDGGTGRRTNLNCTCSGLPPDDISQGVDLNRNFDFQWASDLDACEAGGNHPGSMPFSEPESQAVRDVVLKHEPAAVMSFHSRSRSDQALLVLPYSSDASPPSADRSSLDKLRLWATDMARRRRRNLYVVGNASETVGYTARGVAIDWMLRSANVTAPFVHESGTPCGERWCDERAHGARARDDARLYAASGVRLVELVLGMDDDGNGAVHWLSPWLAAAILAVALILPATGGRSRTASRRARRALWRTLQAAKARRGKKRKDVDRTDVEMHHLMKAPL